MVPFWIPSIIRHLIFRVPKKGTIILTTTHVSPRQPDHAPKVNAFRPGLGASEIWTFPYKFGVPLKGEGYVDLGFSLPFWYPFAPDNGESSGQEDGE